MGAVLLSPLYILLNLYLISRMLLWFSTLHSFLGTPWFIAPFLSCYVLIALSPLMAAFSHGKWKQVSRIISNYWLGTLMYMLIFLLLFDLGRILLRLSRKRSLFDPIDIDSYRISGGIIFFGVILLSVYGIVHAGKIRKKHYDVNICKKLSASSTHTPDCQTKCPPESLAPVLRIALIADLHLGGSVGLPHARKMKKIIDRMQPDLIIYAGDIFDNDFDAIDKPGEIAAVFRSLSSTYGSYACWGNHDIDEVILAGFTFNSGSAATTSDPRMDQFLVDANIRLLKDETVLINDSFYLIGTARCLLPPEKRHHPQDCRRADPATRCFTPSNCNRPPAIRAFRARSRGCRSRPLRSYTRRPALPRQYHDPDRLEKFLRQARPWQYDQYRYLRCRRLGAGHANRDRQRGRRGGCDISVLSQTAKSFTSLFAVRTQVFTADIRSALIVTALRMPSAPLQLYYCSHYSLHTNHACGDDKYLLHKPDKRAERCLNTIFHNRYGHAVQISARNQRNEQWYFHDQHRRAADAGLQLCDQRRHRHRQKQSDHCISPHSSDQKNKPCQCSAEPDRDQLRAAQLKDQGKANAAKSCHDDL